MSTFLSMDFETELALYACAISISILIFHLASKADRRAGRVHSGAVTSSRQTDGTYYTLVPNLTEDDLETGEYLQITSFYFTI